MDTEYNNFRILEEKAFNKTLHCSGATSLGEFYYMMYRDVLRYSSNRKWYAYENHKWKVATDSEVRYKLISLIDIYDTSMNAVMDRWTKERIEVVLRLLRMKASQDRVINYSKMLFKVRKEDFSWKFDEKKDLIGFQNGVYDVTTNSFREGKKTDYITMCVGYDYDKEVNEEKRAMLLKYFEEVIPDKEMREYLLRALSMCIVGKTSDKSIYILKGHGQNGRGVLKTIMRMTLGGYFCENLGTDKSRMMTIRETNGFFEKRVVKLMRAMNGEEHFRCFVITNEDPNKNEKNSGVMDGIRVINFPNSFVEARCLRENERHKDTSMREKFKNCGMEMMRILIEKYNEYKDGM